MNTYQEMVARARWWQSWVFLAAAAGDVLVMMVAGPGFLRWFCFFLVWLGLGEVVFAETLWRAKCRGAHRKSASMAAVGE